MRVDLPLDKKTVENQDWATGPPGRRASGPLGRGPAFSKTPLFTAPLKFEIEMVFKFSLIEFHTLGPLNLMLNIPLNLFLL